MTFMLCRNRVKEFGRWTPVLDSHASAHVCSGIHLEYLWRGLEGCNNVFHLFRVDSAEWAKAFFSAPEAAQAGDSAGVLDGEYHFIESADAAVSSPTRTR